MPNWQRTINLQPEWAQAKSGEITTQTLAKIIGDRLARLRPLTNEDAEETRQNLIEDFQAMAKDISLEVDDFDDMMSNLYDWGDTPLDQQWNGKRVCWINISCRQAASPPASEDADADR